MPRHPTSSREAPPPAAATGTDLVAWHHLRVEVPDTWEVTAYSVEDRVGRLEFNDRNGLLATVGWEPCNREPDREGTMRVFLQNNVLGRNAERRIAPEDLETADIGPFLLGWDKQGAGPCQALAYNAKAAKILRWTFEPRVRTGGLRWNAALAPILSTWGFNDGPEREYRLHRLHCRLPEGYEIEDVVVLPANVKFAFEHAEHRRRAVFRRWGMAEMILRGLSLGAFHAHILKTDGAAIRSQTPCLVSGMEGCVTEFDAPREHHADRFMARRWKGGIGVVWHDRDEKRLYAFEQIGPKKSPPLDFSATIPGRTLDGVSVDTMPVVT